MAARNAAKPRISTSSGAASMLRHHPPPPASLPAARPLLVIVRSACNRIRLALVAH
jgi:hypothetical protein